MPRKKVIDRQAVAKIVYIYLRVSTEKQRKDGKGLQAQLEECQRICEKLGLTVLKIVSDPRIEEETTTRINYSGKLPWTQRPALKEAMEGCAAGLAGGIVTYEQGRYARAMGVDEAIREHAKANEYKLYAGTEEITDDDNDLSADLRALFASMERKMIIRRLRGGRRQRAEVDGRGTAPLPYGFCFRQDGAGPEIAIDQERAPIARQILRLVKIERRTYRYTAEYLNSQGIPSPFAGRIRTSGARQGEPFSGRWSAGQIQKIIANYDLYTTGIKQWDGIEAETRWPILFNPDEETKGLA